MKSPADDEQRHRQRDLRRRERRAEARRRARARRLAGLALERRRSRSGRVLCSAGKRPNSTPVPIASAAANSITDRVDRRTASSSAACGRQQRRDQRSASTARRAAPPTPPNEREQHDSVEQLPRPAAPRLAPIDSRTAISPARAAPRASSRLAMFAQAISSTNAGDAEQQHQRRLRLACDRALAAAPGSSSDRLGPEPRHRLSLMPFCSGASTSLTIAWYGVVDRRARLLDRDARLQPREQIDPVVAPVVERLRTAASKPRIVIGTKTCGLHAERRAVEALRRDADDRHRLAVDDQRLVRATAGIARRTASASRRS